MSENGPLSDPDYIPIDVTGGCGDLPSELPSGEEVVVIVEVDGSVPESGLPDGDETAPDPDDTPSDPNEPLPDPPPPDPDEASQPESGPAPMALAKRRVPIVHVALWMWNPNSQKWHPAPQALDLGHPWHRCGGWRFWLPIPRGAKHATFALKLKPKYAGRRFRITVQRKQKKVAKVFTLG